MIDLPRLGCINLHASLLPKYRGAAPIQWSLIRGEAVTGVTTMRIDVGLDTGDTLLKREVAIQDDDTAETLGARLSQMGADLMVETLRRLEQGNLEAQPQDHAQATLAPILKKEDGRIDWNLPALEIWNRIRGLRPWPGAYTQVSRQEPAHLVGIPSRRGRDNAARSGNAGRWNEQAPRGICGQGTDAGSEGNSTGRPQTPRSARFSQWSENQPRRNTG